MEILGRSSGLKKYDDFTSFYIEERNEKESQSLSYQWIKIIKGTRDFFFIQS